MLQHVSQISSRPVLEVRCHLVHHENV